MPTVSVIIPNYNHADFLPKRIESVLNQTYTDLDVILLDDCSTDNSRDIIKAYAEKDNRIHYYFNEQNGGSTFKQWNKGVSLAQGKYIWIAESDDYAHEEFLEILVSKLEELPEVGLGYTQSFIVNENNKIVAKASEWSVRMFRERYDADFTHSGKYECSNYLVLENTIPNASAVVFKKEIYEKAGIANEQFKLAGDWMQWTRMLLISDVLFIAKPLNFYRWHESTVRRKHSTILTEIRECNQIIRHIAEQVTVDRKAIILSFNILLDRWLLKIQEEPFSDIYYSQLLEIASCDGIPLESLKRMQARLLRQWVDNILERKLSFQNNLKIYQSARKIDNTIRTKLLKKLIKRLAGKE